MADRPTVLVTGASSGIGLACALRLDRLGWQVLAGVRRDEDARCLAGQASPRLRPVSLDITDAAAVAAAVELAVMVAGEAGLAGLVNNAGIVVAGALEYLPDEWLQRQLEVNVVGQLRVTRACLPLLRAGRGRIVFLGSMGGRIAGPFLGPYHASKFALEALTDSLRGELRPWGIPVAIVEPGVIATPIWATSVAAVDRWLATLPAEAWARYGPVVGDLRRRALRSGERGRSPEVVVDAIVHALTALRPRTRYVVGWDARLALLAAHLPDRLRDRLLALRQPRYGG
ncbi:MAG: SDR family oxidoreductase [Chloroflexi bacterium]|nr:SDR family oxidoreductase [Chloroflexota bacterium]